MKNHAQSIRNRLVALGKRENIWFNYLIVRFCMNAYCIDFRYRHMRTSFALKLGLEFNYFRFISVAAYRIV